MTQITKLLQAVEAGDESASELLLPLVYDELRELAASYLAREFDAQSHQATSIVHEAYLRLIGDGHGVVWNGRGHFFGAAAQAMRRILVESARRRKSIKRGGNVAHHPLDENVSGGSSEPAEDLVLLDEALTKLQSVHPQAAELVQLVYFSGLTLRQAAEILEMPSRTVDRLWAYAKAWLRYELREQNS